MGSMSERVGVGVTQELWTGSSQSAWKETQAFSAKTQSEENRRQQVSGSPSPPLTLSAHLDVHTTEHCTCSPRLPYPAPPAFTLPLQRTLTSVAQSTALANPPPSSVRTSYIHPCP